MDYELNDMVRIRAMREDRSAAGLVAARRVVSRAQEALELSRRNLAEYEATKESRRNRIFAAVVGRAVTMDELDLAREGIARIDEEGILKADNALRAEAELKKRRDEAEVCHMAFVSASKRRMKIAEHRVAWEIEEEAASERRQEVELEDFSGKKVADDAEPDES